MGRHGVPEEIVTNHNRQSALSRNLSCALGSYRLRTTAYCPQANGLVERFHRQLKASIKAHEAPTQWVDLLLVALHGLCTTVKKDLECAPSQVVFSMTLFASRICRRLKKPVLSLYCKLLCRMNPRHVPLALPHSNQRGNFNNSLCGKRYLFS